MTKLSLKAIAFLQAAGVVAYILLFASTVQFLGRHFEKVQISPVFSMALALMAFVFSATVCATIFLGYPAYLLVEGKKKESVHLILKSIAWLAVFLVTFLIILSLTTSL